MPATRSTAIRCRLALVSSIACAASSCRAGAPPPTQEPAPKPAPVAPVHAEGPHERGLEELVAVVDGVEIREADVERLVRVASTSPGTPPQPREVLVLRLIERQLVAQAAKLQSIAATEEEIDRAVQLLIADLGIDTEQLRTAVNETTELSWEEYRGELAAQILEMKLLWSSLPLQDTEWGVPSTVWDEEHLASARARTIGCLRARAEVKLEDASVELPDNPFAIAATLAGVRFVEDPVLPAVEVEVAATSAAAGRPLCDSLTAAELAMTELYLEHGYLDAQVKIPWPETPGTSTIEVETMPGARHVLGKIELDQSAIPKGKRVSEKALRKKIAAVGKTGDAAGISRLRGIAEVVRWAFSDAGLGPVKLEVTRTPVGEEKRVDVVFRVGVAEA